MQKTKDLILEELNTLNTKRIGRQNCVKQVTEKTWRLILSNLDEAAESSLVSNQAASTETSSTETSSTPKSSTSSLRYQQKLSNEDFLLLKSSYESIQNKWVLRSGTCVEDIMYKASRKFIYEQHDDPELYWVKESVLDYIELFYDTNLAMFNSEQDLLDEVYGFIKKKSRRISKTRTETVTGSRASAETKNKTRSLGTMKMLCRQIPGDLADLSFLHKSTEIGCLEIGLSDKGSNGTKELQEKCLKTPRMMKAFVIQAASSFPTIDISKVETVGFVISGMFACGS
ncbi:hypothetical protein MAM1_0085d04703 [Mucor ambiguus]|uniref:Uncharacterized protein n=1 Tax=Mucor ambiguus TaxID=91626 RepID=A0A0C9MD22_9FUNG|nr:hypothetical protein MAM1_0085d04703 [Mucor ambiguus]